VLCNTSRSKQFITAGNLECVQIAVSSNL
jgi:hypothetical protein